jgi:hypothetical protein
MSKTFKDSPQRKQVRSGRGRQRNISVRAVRRDSPDLQKMSRALMRATIAEAEAEATQLEQQSNTSPQPDGPEPRD